MAWRGVEKSVFSRAIDALDDTAGEIIGNTNLSMLEFFDDFRCVIREGDHDPTDPPPAGYSGYLINGDLEMAEALDISRLNDPVADGQMIFVVTGALTCPRFVSDWGSVILIGGNLTVTELMFIARADSAIYVLGHISVWALVGRDIWVTFETGANVSIEYGVGYALRRQRGSPLQPGDMVRPMASEAESMQRLGLADWEATFDMGIALAGDLPPFR